jgi:NAD(P)-dependent dehydrogenase (short-subunit alcohol dehydrogenase family)
MELAGERARKTRAACPRSPSVQDDIINIVTIGGSVNVAILKFTKAIADIKVKDGVRVNAINPGLIKTRRFTQGPIIRVDGGATRSL